MTGLQPPAPYPADDQEARDRSNLRVLSVCFYVFAGLSALAVLGLLAYGVFMQWFFGEMMDDVRAQMAAQAAAAAQQNPQAPAPPPPPDFMRHFGAIYLVFCIFGAVFVLAQAILAFLAARAIAVPRSRGICIAGAVAACLAFPHGTLLGVFALVVLVRPSVERLFLRTDGRRGSAGLR